ncbi:MAG: excisionase [Candidatus Phlomobacter fragariae]
MITLAEWNARRDKPRRMDTIRNWARNGLYSHYLSKTAENKLSKNTPSKSTVLEKSAIVIYYKG